MESFLSVSSFCSVTHWFCFTLKTPAVLEGSKEKPAKDKFLKSKPSAWKRTQCNLEGISGQRPGGYDH